MFLANVRDMNFLALKTSRDTIALIAFWIHVHIDLFKLYQQL